MTSSKPYLIRALYDWIADNDLTPYIVVNAEAKGVNVPQQYIEAGRIILNISMQATHGLELRNDFIEFSARFAGVSMDIVVPISAVLAIYARENGRGMVFNDEDDANDNDSGGNNAPDAPQAPRGKPKLTIVK